MPHVLPLARALIILVGGAALVTFLLHYPHWSRRMATYDDVTGELDRNLAALSLSTGATGSIPEIDVAKKENESARGVGLVYDERMLAHEDPLSDHPEQPARISSIYACLEKFGLAQRCVRVEAREATDGELRSVHTADHIRQMRGISKGGRSMPDMVALAQQYNSIYFNQGSSASALLAAGSLVELALRVARGELGAGAAVIRPPGHHAEADKAMGFCLFNNVAVAAHVLVHHQPELNIKRLLIVDWDVHHGNGVQRMFYRDPRVLYFSVHRYDHGGFYPGGDDGDYPMVGAGAAVGMNVNVPWEGPRHGDAEYLAAWQHVLMPVARAFRPDVVLISGGFDAALGDPLGGCSLTPYGYSHMTHQVRKELAPYWPVLADPVDIPCCSPSPLSPRASRNFIQGEGDWEEKVEPASDGDGQEATRASLAALNVSSSSSDAQLGGGRGGAGGGGAGLEQGVAVPALAPASAGQQARGDTAVPCASPSSQLPEPTSQGSAVDARNEDGPVPEGDERSVDALTAAAAAAPEPFPLLQQQQEEEGAAPAAAAAAVAPVDANADADADAAAAAAAEEASSSSSSYVWYASYGSNMWHDRFMCYIRGGKVAGMDTAVAGCRDQTAPVAAQGMSVPYRMWFGRSKTATWGLGGVCFLDPTPSPHHSAFIRMYLITLEQFNDVVKQENGRSAANERPLLVTLSHVQRLRSSATAAAAAPPPLSLLRTLDVVPGGWYGTVAYLGEKEGAPILTFTCSSEDVAKFYEGHLAVNPPSSRYSFVVAKGLVDHIGLSPEEAHAYIARRSVPLAG
eukprot:jgi/Mesen1/8875/ME000530S08285